MTISFVTNTIRVAALIVTVLVGQAALAQEKSPAEDASKKNNTSPTNPSSTTPAAPSEPKEADPTKTSADKQKSATDSKSPASSAADSTEKNTSPTERTKTPGSSTDSDKSPTSSDPSSPKSVPNPPKSEDESPTDNPSQNQLGDTDSSDTTPGSGITTPSQSDLNKLNQKSKTTTKSNDQFRFNQPGTQTQPNSANARDNDDDSAPGNRTGRNNSEDANEDDRPAPPSESDFGDRTSDNLSNDNGDDESYDNDDRRFSNQPGSRVNRRAEDRERDDDRDDDRADNRQYDRRDNDRRENGRGDDDRRDDRRGDNRRDEDRRDNDRDVNVSLGVRVDLDNSNRLIVRERYSSGLLARANVRQGDIIISVNNRPISSTQMLTRYVRDYRGSGPLPIIVLRNGVRQTIYVEQTANYEVNETPEQLAWADEESAWLGVTLNARYQTSAVVQEVQPGSPAERAGVQPNDWIVNINGQRIMSPRHLSQVVRDMEPGSEISLQVSRRVLGQLQATLTDRPAYDDESQARPEQATSYEE